MSSPGRRNFITQRVSTSGTRRDFLSLPHLDYASLPPGGSAYTVLISEPKPRSDDSTDDRKSDSAD